MTIRIVLVSILFIFAVCGKKADSRNRVPGVASGLILFKVGSAQAAGKELNNGDLIDGKAMITTGPQSILDIQVRDGDGSVSLRLQANSSLTLATFTSAEGTVVSPLLQSGSILAQVKKSTSGSALEVRMPTSVAAVRGTKFAASIEGGGNSKIDVYEGSVAARPRVATLEDLPAGVVQDNQLNPVITALEQSEVVVESGKSVEVPKSASETVVANAGLTELLAKPEIVALAGKSDASKAEIDAASAAIKAHVASPEGAKKIQSVQPAPKAAPATIPAEEMKNRLKEYDEFIALEKSKVQNADDAKKEVQAAAVAQKEARMKRIEQIMQKSMETLILKDGRRIQGVIMQEGADYTVLTPEGRQFFPGSTVEGFAF